MKHKVKTEDLLKESTKRFKKLIFYCTSWFIPKEGYCGIDGCEYHKGKKSETHSKD